MVNFITDAKRQVVEEIHRPARINFQRRRVIIKSLDDLFQADLVEMLPYSSVNNGYKYILVVINCFSKYVYAIPLKSKQGREVTVAMEKVLKQQSPKNLQTDGGREFFNEHFKKMMKKYNINHYQVFSEKKASIVERVNRTLKGMMWKEFSLQGSYKWVNILQKIVDTYNNKVHRTIGMKPTQVSKKNEKHLLNTVYSHMKISHPKRKFKVNDYVRISKVRGVFDKKYLPNWSTEIFQVTKVQLTNPTTYLLKDENNRNVLGAFYQEQLSKVKYPDVFLVEKVLKRRGNKVFVKWIGFSDKHNSWIDSNNIA